MTRETIAELLARAAEEPIGLLVEIEGNRDSFEQMINQSFPAPTREVVIAMPAIPDCVFLVRRSADLPL